VVGLVDFVHYATIYGLLGKAQRPVDFPETVVPNGELSTAQLAQQTGVSPGTLRMWESRHGFPSPARLPGGHRRYSERDVEAVLEVVRLRADGMSMSSAIRRAVSSAGPPTMSIFAGLRRARSDLAPIGVSKRALMAVSRAIEDEYCARGAGGLLIGSFQRRRHYGQSRRRWMEVARGAEVAVALADFDRRRDPIGAATEVPVGAGQPLAREWALIVDAPSIQACVAGWELPSERPRPDPDRRFEVVWAFEPEAVRAASEAAIDVLRDGAPALADRAAAALGRSPATAAAQLRSGSALAQRVVSYLAAIAC
jgi:DICT domain-containing protein/predicted DNA-binding transcriptional regulator AlpA